MGFVIVATENASNRFTNWKWGKL